MIGKIFTVCAYIAATGRNFLRSTTAKVAVGTGLVLGAANQVMATPPPFELAETGVDVGAGITAAITAIGVVVLVAIGGWFAFRVVRRALGWARTAF